MMQKMGQIGRFVWTRLIAVGTTILAEALMATPVTEADVTKAMTTWRTRRTTLGLTMGTNVSGVRRVEGKGIAFYVTRFENGGVTIVPTDTTVRPVIMFSDEADFDEDPENPIWDLLVSEFSARQKKAPQPRLMAAPLDAEQAESEAIWAELLSDQGQKLVYAGGVSSISDVRVGPLVSSRWNQKSVDGYWCYNYYTPDHYPCGCVATAAAQVMRYFEYPAATTAIASYSNPYCQIDGTATTLTTKGGTYDWSQMPYSPSGSTPSAQRQMIGKLTSDLGILMAMSYKSGGSGTGSYCVAPVLTRFFGYANAIAFTRTGATTYTGVGDAFQRLFMSNFDAKLPVVIELSDHAVVGDGYGYSGGKLYYHLNFGWTGAYWYTPPNMEEYTCFEGAVYNIYTTRQNSPVIASGRVVDSNGRPVSGVTVSAAKTSSLNSVVATAVTDSRGIYAVFVPAGAYRLSVDLMTNNGDEHKFGSCTATVRQCVALDVVGASASGMMPNRGYFTSPSPEIGNAAQCDIQLRTEYANPEATVKVETPIEVGTNYASAALTVTAQVIHYSETAKSAQVVVTLAPVAGGAVQTRTFALNGDKDEHVYPLTFTGLTAGVRYQVEAKVVIGQTPFTDRTDFVAGRSTPWIDEDKTTFPNSSWAYTADKVQTGSSRISLIDDIGRTTAPGARYSASTGADYADIHFTTRIFCGTDLANLQSLTGRAGFSLVTVQTNTPPHYAVRGSDGWHVTDFEAESVDSTYEIFVRINRVEGWISYHVRPTEGEWINLGTYNTGTDDAVVRMLKFYGSQEVVKIKGEQIDANLIAAADGTEFPNLADALASGTTDVLSPLWLSTATFPTNQLGIVALSDPNNLLRVTADAGATVFRTTTTNGVTRHWFCEPLSTEQANQLSQKIDTLITSGIAEQDLADWFIANRNHLTGTDLSTSSYVGASSRLGLNTLLNPASTLDIRDFTLLDNTLRFKVALNGILMTHPSLTEMVEATTNLLVNKQGSNKQGSVPITQGSVPTTKWGPAPANLVNLNSGELTIHKNGTRLFLRVKLPEDPR